MSTAAQVDPYVDDDVSSAELPLAARGEEPPGSGGSTPGPPLSQVGPARMVQERG